MQQMEVCSNVYIKRMMISLGLLIEFRWESVTFATHLD